MTEETTSEQLAEIEGQGECTPATEYTPPEGWRVLAVGELLQEGDQWVNWEGTVSRPDILHGDGTKASGGRYIRRIKPEAQPEAQPQPLPEPEPQPQPEQYTPPDGWRVLAVGEVLRDSDVTVRADGYQYPTERVGSVVGAKQRYIRPIELEPQPQPVQVREGRWRTRNGLIKTVTAMPPDHEDFTARYPWWDGVSTWRDDGRWLEGGSTMDLATYLGPIEEQPEPQHNGLVRDVTHLLQESGVLDSAKAEQQIEELRSEVSYVQRLLGESRQRVTHLEELVTSLRTINRGCENAVRLAGQENTDLKHRLETIAAEWAEQSETVRKLRIELDAREQVPQVIADRFEEGWNQGTARAVETIAEWLEPIRAVDHLNLSNETLQHLPQIMRHLTGLAQD